MLLNGAQNLVNVLRNYTEMSSISKKNVKVKNLAKFYTFCIDIPIYFSTVNR